MVEDLNHKHEFNVSEINSVKTSQQLLAKDMEALEDRVSLVVDAQDDILKEMKKVKHCDGN